MRSAKRYAFDLTRPLHRYVWQLGGLLGKFVLILDSLGVVGLGLSGAGLLTTAFAENDRLLELGLRVGMLSLCAGVACFGLARLLDFIGKFRDGEDPRSLVLKQRQLRSTDLRPDAIPPRTVAQGNSSESSRPTGVRVGYNQAASAKVHDLRASSTTSPPPVAPFLASNLTAQGSESSPSEELANVHPFTRTTGKR